MKNIRLIGIYAIFSIALLHCGFTKAQLPNLLPQIQTESSAKTSPAPKSVQAVSQQAQLDPINNYIRAAKITRLPLSEEVRLNSSTKALAYAINPPEKDNAIWSLRYQLLDNTAAAINLRLVTIKFDEYQRVTGFDTLLERSGLAEVTVDELLWPSKPVYLLVSTNPPSPAKLTIEAIKKNWSVLESLGAYSDQIDLISDDPVSKKVDFTWKPSLITGEQPLWDLKLVTEPGTHYSLQMRSGNQSANVMGKANEPLTFNNIHSPEAALRLSIKPKGKRFSRIAVMLNQQPLVVTDSEHELSAPRTLSYGEAGSGTISHLSGTGMLRPETDTWIFESPASSSSDTESLPTQIRVIPNNTAHDVKLSLKKVGRLLPLSKQSAVGELTSGPLLLEAGKYEINVSSDSLGVSYRVKLGSADKQSANSEKEPNNSEQDANPIASRRVVKGELTGPQDEDFFVLDTSGEGAAQYWRLITTGGGVKRITLGNKYWIDAHKADTSPTLSMDYMLLLPGAHTLKLTGEGRYSLRAIPLGPPKPGFEIEPNDGKLGPSGRLTIGETATGSLDKAIVTGHSDIDRYRFSIQQRGKYQITVVAPEDEAIQSSLLLNGGPWFTGKQTLPAGSTTNYAGQLLAGEYIVELTNLRGHRALDEYSVLVEKLPDTTYVGNEPNDIVGFSTPLVRTGLISTNLGPFDQKDCYRLEPSLSASSIEIKGDYKLNVRFLDKYSRPKKAQVKRDPVNRMLWSVGPHEEALFVCVSGAGQIIAPREYTLNVTLGASSPVSKAQLATTRLPKVMQGGLNVAWYGLGARWETIQEDIPTKTAASTIKKLNRVINNISPLGAGAEWDALKNNAAEYRLKLASDKPIPLVGIVVNTRTNNHVRRKTRHFRLLASQDGINFSQVMLGELSFSNKDQYLVFDKPISTNYIKFLPLDSFQSRSPHYARFQELKLIASPEYSLSGQGLNLASPAVGGHIVKHGFKPVIKNNLDALDAAILHPQTDGSASKLLDCQFSAKRNTAEWVLGFHHNRAARVTNLDYTVDDTNDGSPQFESLKVSVSAQSPLGPWREVANWSSAQLKSTLTIPMKESSWVRFVRFVATGKPNTKYRCPQDIALKEAVPSSGYRSVLGEWSEYGSNGPYELALRNPKYDYSPKGGLGIDNTKTITLDQLIVSSVKRERNSDWFSYQFGMEKDKSNSLLIQVAHPNSFKPLVSVHNANGETIQTVIEPVDKTHKYQIDNDAILPHGWTTTNYVAWTPDNSIYSIQVEEPPRNVVLTWDSSGSMGPQLPYIEMASRRWAEYLKPDHEFAKVMKFAQKSHPKNEWANLPHMLQGALHTISQKTRGSSDAENSLFAANELLAPRYGSHAIVVTTDGEYKRSSIFWESQKQHCSSIYAAGLGAAAVGEDFILQSVYQDNFQNWVSACGGQYRYCDSVTCLEDFYEFAAVDIRKAKPYQLKISEIYRSPPKPGFLSVIASTMSEKATAKALYVILDASGSMLKTLNGKLRIDIAKKYFKESGERKCWQAESFCFAYIRFESWSMSSCAHAARWSAQL